MKRKVLRIEQYRLLNTSLSSRPYSWSLTGIKTLSFLHKRWVDVQIGEFRSELWQLSRTDHHRHEQLWAVVGNVRFANICLAIQPAKREQREEAIDRFRETTSGEFKKKLLNILHASISEFKLSTRRQELQELSSQFLAHCVACKVNTQVFARSWSKKTFDHQSKTCFTQILASLGKVHVLSTN